MFQVWILLYGLVGAQMSWVLRPFIGSGEFKWFRERGDDFVYIDRIAVSPWFRKRGIAARLYADIEKYARSLDAKRLTLEVNVMPRNDVSLAFHQRMGFTSLDERDTDYGTRVVMMEKML